MIHIRYATYSSAHATEENTDLWKQLATLQVDATYARDPDANKRDRDLDIMLTEEALDSFRTMTCDDDYTLVVAFADIPDKSGNTRAIPAAYGLIAASPYHSENPAILDQLYALSEIKLGKVRFNLKEFSLGRNVLDMLTQAAQKEHDRNEVITYPLNGSEGFYSRNGFRRGQSGDQMWTLHF